MATNIVLHWAGPPEQKHAVRMSPMGRLTDALVEACAKFKLDPAACTVMLNKKAADLQAPFRFLNAPTNARFDVVLAPQPPAAAVAAAAAGSSSGAARVVASSGAAAAAAAAPAAAASGAEALPPSPGDAAGAPAAAGAGEAAGAGPSSSQQGGLAALGIDRPLLVFTQAALEEAGRRAAEMLGGAANEPGDDFFELTPEDLGRIMAQTEAKKKQAAVFRTRAAREAQAGQRAAAYGPVRVRLHLPDGHIVQTAFAASDTVGDVARLAAAVLVPEAAAGCYLFTAPPKQVLKDAEQSLAAAQLVPAAHVYVGIKAEGLPGPLLRPEVAALRRGDALPQEVDPSVQAAAAQRAAAEAAAAAAPSGGGGQGDVQAVRAAAAAAAAGSRSAAAGDGGGEKKVPKWLKLSK